MTYAVRPHDLWRQSQRATCSPSSQGPLVGGEQHPEGSSTFVRSENQEVQSLEHVHLLDGQRPVKHRHRREVVCKGGLVTQRGEPTTLP